eukprot:34635_1
MSTNETSAKWINLLACPITDSMTIPTGIDRNNYIVIDGKYSSLLFGKCVYKYNIDTNKWNTISGLNNLLLLSSALDVEKQILYLIHKHSVCEI